MRNTRMKSNDLTGQRFGRLTALYWLPERKNKCFLWMCQCECGSMKAIPSTDLTLHRVKSCGCLWHRVKDITGEKRGHLTALRYTGQRDERGYALYEWRCDCGNVFIRSVAGTSNANNARICPECRKRIKSRHIALARSNREEDETTGLTKKYLLNLINGVPTGRNTSGVRGVHWHAGHQRWVATGRQNGKLVTLGEYEDIADAAEARREYVMKTYGNAARKLGIV